MSTLHELLGELEKKCDRTLTSPIPFRKSKAYEMKKLISALRVAHDALILLERDFNPVIHANANVSGFCREYRRAIREILGVKE